MDPSEVVQGLAALAHAVRLRAYRALMVAGSAGLSQKALAEAVGVSPSNLAFHLKELMLAGLLSREQAGQFVTYRAAYERMADLLVYLTDNCCQGAPCPVNDRFVGSRACTDEGCGR
jgi:DNA-binding transcriptional ArsR family regulator